MWRSITQFIWFLLPAAIIALVGLSLNLSARQVEKRSSPTISFSKDERTVAIHYEKGKWTLQRPVVASWDFKAVGKVLWVAVNGDDANEGSLDKPFRTIGKAVEMVAPGDVVYVRAGTYVENIRIKKSGQEDRPIILSCAPGELGKVKITPPKEYVEKKPSGAVITLHSVQHVWINGLVIEGPMGRPEAPANEMYGANGITFAGKAGLGCRVTNCVVYWNVHCGIKEMGHGGTKILMEANVIFDNGTRSTDHGIYCPADDLAINGNIIFNNAGYGIHSYSHPKRQWITRNICMGNKAAGIILAGEGNKVYHNVCAYNGLGIMYFRGGCTGNIVKNNIFAFNKTDCGYDNGGGKYGDPANNQDDFNCYFPGKPQERIQPGRNEILADPLFVNAKDGDFRLQANSPCLGKGVNVGLPFNGKAPDVGTFFTIRVLFSEKFVQPERDVPKEARQARPGPDAKPEAFSKLVAGKIISVTVTYFDPKKLKGKMETEDFLRRLLTTPKGSTYNHIPWAQSLSVPTVAATVEHAQDKAGTWIVWDAGQSVYCAYKDGHGRWWFSVWFQDEIPR